MLNRPDGLEDIVSAVTLPGDDSGQRMKGAKVPIVKGGGTLSWRGFGVSRLQQS